MHKYSAVMQPSFNTNIALYRPCLENIIKSMQAVNGMRATTSYEKTGDLQRSESMCRKPYIYAGHVQHAYVHKLAVFFFPVYKTTILHYQIKDKDKDSYFNWDSL